MNNPIQQIKKPRLNTIITVSVLVTAALLVISYPLFLEPALANAALSNIIKAQSKLNPVVTEMYAHVKEKQKIFDDLTDPGVEQYLSLGFSWKSLADQMRPRSDSDFRNADGDKLYILRRALDVYEAGIKKFKKTNSILYLNAANLWRERGHLEGDSIAYYEKAEKRYLQALELDAGDPNNHLVLIDLYKNELKKTEAVIKARYDLASKTVINSIPIAISFAAYVRSLGQYEKALEFYQAIYEVLKRPEFKRAIEEIKIEIKNSKLKIQN